MSRAVSTVAVMAVQSNKGAAVVALPTCASTPALCTIESSWPAVAVELAQTQTPEGSMAAAVRAAAALAVQEQPDNPQARMAEQVAAQEAASKKAARAAWARRAD